MCGPRSTRTSSLKPRRYIEEASPTFTEPAEVRSWNPRGPALPFKVRLDEVAEPPDIWAMASHIRGRFALRERAAELNVSTLSSLETSHLQVAGTTLALLSPWPPLLKEYDAINK